MECVTGIGGVFFKSPDPAALTRWYQEHLGVQLHPDGAVVFEWREIAPPARKAMTVWSPFPQHTKYFHPSTAPFMVNYRVENLDRMLAQLRAAGIPVDDHIEESDYGRFGWAMDPDGNRFELWQPPAAEPEGT